jgi:hypothetical protein
LGSVPECFRVGKDLVDVKLWRVVDTRREGPVWRHPPYFYPAIELSKPIRDFVAIDRKG